MRVDMEFLFLSGAGYDELVKRLTSNPRFVFKVVGESRIDKRTKRARVKGWVKVRHSRAGTHRGTIKIIKDHGCCWCEINDQSMGRLTGSWTSWLLRNADDLVGGIDMRHV